MTIDVRPATTARLRRKNQLTVPESAVAGAGAQEGDTFLVTVEDGVIHLQRVLPSYSGALAGVYPDDWAEQLRKDRDAWRS